VNSQKRQRVVCGMSGSPNESRRNFTEMSSKTEPFDEIFPSFVKLARCWSWGRRMLLMKKLNQKNSPFKVELVRSKIGLCLLLELSVADYVTKLHNCECLSRALIWGTGIDVAPLNKLVGVCVNLNENDSALCGGINEFLGVRKPSRIWARNLRLVLNNLSKSKVGRFVLIPEQGMIESSHSTTVPNLARLH